MIRLAGEKDPVLEKFDFATPSPPARIAKIAVREDLFDRWRFFAVAQISSFISLY